jgi:ferrous iron transport protein B
VENRSLKIALAGNPNSGKTSIFNGLTGTRQKVANFPGVTVEKRSGQKKYRDYNITFVDLPGTYSLTSYTIDEKVTRDFIVDENPDLVINVVDSGSLERSLYLTMQLIEIGIDLVIDLNMWDESQEAGIEIDTEKLSSLLGAPVVKTIGNRAQGIDKLLEESIALIESEHETHHHPPVTYGPKLDDIVGELSQEVDRCNDCRGCCNPRWLAVKLLEGDNDVRARCVPSERSGESLATVLDKSIEHLRSTVNDDPEIVITEGRYGYVAGIIREVLKRPATDRMNISNQVDKFLTHRYFGYPIFLLMMFLIFQAVFTIGQYPMVWIESGVAVLQDFSAGFLPEGILSDLINDGIIGGIGSVLVFLPNIIILFLGISLLEDSGYMARAAFLMDRLMHFLGLHGKSFIPMLMGFGCSVPAIMSTRTLESQKDRILTILLLPFISCNAKLPVYILFAGTFFGAAAGTVIFSLYLIGILLAVIVARFLIKTVVKGDDLPFVMELPPYRWPTARSVLIHMWDRSRIYLRKMGGIILVASIILWALGYFPRKQEFTQNYDSQIESMAISNIAGANHEIEKLIWEKASEEIEYTVLGRLGKVVGPIVEPLGFNWQMGVSLISGFIAKEVVVSSMGVLYSLGEEQDETSESLSQALRNPDSGLTHLSAYAFMIFVLLYTQCIVAILTVKKEIGIKWMWFTIFFQLALAWTAAFVVYQGGLILGLG